MEYKSDCNTNQSWSPLNNPKALGEETGRTGNPRKNRDHSIAEIN